MKLGIKLLLILIAVGIFIYWLINHSGYFPYSHNPIQYMPNMHRSPAIRPQEKRPLAYPEGSISREEFIYPYDRDVPVEKVERKENPLPKTREVVERGQKMFNTHCIVCHGPLGLGDGFVVPPFAKPPSLQSERVREFADSQIFHIITVGQNTMMPYASQIRVEDRWAITHYIRVLHLSQNPSEEDLKAFDMFIGSGQKD